MPRIKMLAKLNAIPTTRPTSIETMTTAKNVAIQTTASKRDIFQNLKKSFTCINIPFKATTIILAKQHCNEINMEMSN